MNRSTCLALICGASLAVLPGCALFTPPGVACTDFAAVSVTAHVVDDAGDDVDDATVTFAVDGGAATACDFNGAGTYSCGFEIAGDFVVTAEKAGFDAASASATVVEDDDGCHVVGETVDLVLVTQLD